MYQTIRAAENQAPQGIKFSPGQIVATPGALAALEEHKVTPLRLLARHLSGDWGDLPPEDAQLNDLALQSEGRLLSSYVIGTDTKIWVITEWDRSVTTLLLPSEY
ncbi:hypothetical protein [Comamonas thiooxydans]|uniref:hypothetical protein n=1 Tax=Comamonas thiooxydans TaxID=363952 RepID=UPI003CFC3AC0